MEAIFSLLPISAARSRSFRSCSFLPINSARTMAIHANPFCRARSRRSLRTPFPPLPLSGAASPPLSQYCTRLPNNRVILFEVCNFDSRENSAVPLSWTARKYSSISYAPRSILSCCCVRTVLINLRILPKQMMSPVFNRARVKKSPAISGKKTLLLDPIFFNWCKSFSKFTRACSLLPRMKSRQPAMPLATKDCGFAPISSSTSAVLPRHRRKPASSR